MSAAEGIECPYCHEMSNDTEFCDFCGKSICNIENSGQEKNSITTIQKEKWMRLEEYDVFISEYRVNEEELIRLPEFIDVPVTYEEFDSTYKLFFEKDNQKDLNTWLSEKYTIDLEKAIEIIKKVCKIISELNKNGYLVGSFDISDFWIEDDDIDTLKLRQTRPFISLESNNVNVRLGEIFAPEIKNKDAENIGYSSDVFIVGKMFLYMIFKKNINDYSELRYLSHQIQLLVPEVPFDIHSWIGKSTSIFTENRYKNVDEQVEELNLMIQKQKMRKASNEKIYTMEYYVQSDAGIGKKENNIEGVSEELLNEDSYLFLGGGEEYNNKALGIVADGISTCKYGSGYKASKIIIDIASSMWEERYEDINSKEEVQEFFQELISKVNENIVSEAMKEIPLDEKGIPQEYVLSSDIMGSTFVGTFLDANKAYIVSIGDSRVYLWDEKHGISLLSIDDNYLNYCVKNNMSWDEIKTLDNKSSLTKFIGGADTKQWPFKSLSVEVDIKEVNLLENEILLMCSDGLTDYLNAIGHRSDEWNSDMKIHEILKGEILQNNSLKEICKRFIEEANENGGGDNITLALIQVKNKFNK